MPAPTIESHGQTTSSSGTTTTISVTAAGAGRAIVVATTIGLTNAGLPAPTLTISGGGANVGAWHQIGLMPFSGIVVGLGVSAWYAVTTGAVSAQTVTITSSATIDDAANAYAAVAGANISAPLDLNAVLAQGGGNNGTGARGTSGTTLPTGALDIAISTNTANVLSFVLMGNSSPITFSPLCSGTTLTESVVNGGGSRYAYLGMMTAPFTTSQSGTLVGATNSGAAAGFAFGVTADAVGGATVSGQYAVSLIT